MDKLHEDSRKQFEEIAANDRSELEVFKRGPMTGEYKNPVVRKMWTYWQASRASIVVDLEEPDSYLTADGTRLAYKAYIRSIGLSIKGE
ncbi:MAG: hypothetical protein E7G96_02565 [Serratia liquefaciens]|nr:hypothetical protein [Serratia liquefaciens]